MNRIDLLAVSNVAAKIATIRPDLETTPREADLRFHGLTIMGVGSERELYGEPAGVASKPLPFHRHELASVPISAVNVRLIA